MDKNTLINQVVNKAYNNLTSLVELRVSAFGGYFGMIIPENELKELSIYADDIINSLYIKFCDYLSKRINPDNIEFIVYKTFCYNNPKEDLINDCFQIVKKDIKAKQSSNETTTLLDSLTSLKQTYSEKEIEKALDTMFDILLNYYSIAISLQL